MPTQTPALPGYNNYNRSGNTFSPPSDSYRLFTKQQRVANVYNMTVIL